MSCRRPTASMLARIGLGPGSPKSGQAAGGAPLLESLEVRVGEQQGAMRNLGLARLVEHEAQDVLDLRLATALDVAQHRRRVLRVALRERLLPRSHKALAGGVTVGGGDGGAA